MLAKTTSEKLPQRGFCRLAARFGRDPSGASAVEFALLIVPFLIALLLVLEVALVFLVGQALENATQHAARLIRTGQAGGFERPAFEESVCESLWMFPNCAEKLKIDVRVVPDFEAAAELPTPLDDEGLVDDRGFGFDGGRGNDIVLVRTYYEWSGTRVLPALLHFFNSWFVGAGSGPEPSATVYTLPAAAVFRNEPFS